MSPENAPSTPQALPLGLEDVVAMPAIRSDWRSLQLSPDGFSVAYAVQDRRRKQSPTLDLQRAYTENTHVRITDIRSGMTRELTDGDDSGWGPAWSPDGSSLAFYRTHGGPTHVWVWDRATDKMRRVSDAAAPHTYSIPGDALRWSPDGKHLLTKLIAEEELAQDAMPCEPGQPTVRVWTQNDACTKIPADLAVMRVTDGAICRLTAGEIPWYAFSPDGARVAYVKLRLETRIFGSYIVPVGTDLGVVSPSGADPQTLATDLPPGLRQAVSWSPDGQTLSYVSQGKCTFASVRGKHAPKTASITDVRADTPPMWDAESRSVFLPSTDALWRIRAADGAADPLAKLPDTGAAAFPERGRVPSADHGQSLSFLTLRDGRAAFHRIVLNTGEIVTNPEIGGLPPNVSHLQCAADGRSAVLLAQDARRCPDIWHIEAESPQGRQVTRINPRLDHYRLGEVWIISWQTEDGQTLQGSLLLPSDFREGRNYPLLVVMYGGASGSTKAHEFGLLGEGVNNMQLFATRGYAVLYPDTPLRLGTPLKDIAATVLPGVDAVVAMGIADPDRLGVMGHSYGGYNTLCLVTQTTRFKAAVCRAEGGNLIRGYFRMAENGWAIGPRWAEVSQGRMGGPPWQYPERYVENSPIFFLDKIETPLLLVQGTADQTLNATPADEVFVGLRRLGKEVTYLKYTGEDHTEDGWSYPNQMDYCHRLIAWFDDHLKPLTVTGEI